MPSYRYALSPATELVLRQYAGPLWCGRPLADAHAEDLPHPKLPPPWVAAGAGAGGGARPSPKSVD